MYYGFSICWIIIRGFMVASYNENVRRRVQVRMHACMHLEQGPFHCNKSILYLIWKINKSIYLSKDPCNAGVLASSACLALSWLESWFQEDISLPCLDPAMTIGLHFSQPACSFILQMCRGALQIFVHPESYFFCDLKRGQVKSSSGKKFYRSKTRTFCRSNFLPVR